MLVWLGVGLAVVIALVVLGFFAYEASWKLARLRRDVATMEQLGTEATALAVAAAQTQARLQRTAAESRAHLAATQRRTG
ncbi:MAG: hypothetical protein ABJA87_08765 [bacterium]